MKLKDEDWWPRPFFLNRLDDESGVSGTGIVAEGVQFSDGICVIHWRSQYHGTTVYQNILEVEQVHGHGGKTEVCWGRAPVSKKGKK